MAYEYKAFPKWKYHATEAPRVVENYEEEEALGEGWTDRPAAVEPAKQDEPAVLSEAKTQQDTLDLGDTAPAADLDALDALDALDPQPKKKRK